MAAPATTGKLCNTIQEMEIGDYIVCNYYSTGSTVGAFNNLGGVSEAEISVTGESIPKGTFYFVKCSKGLLIADRVLHSSITWDTLNNSGVIQGTLPRLTIVPRMTNNTSNGVANANSDISYAYQLFAAGSVSWDPTRVPAWASYEFIQEKVVKSYAITTKYNSKNPSDFTFEGSHDGITWVELDRQSNRTDAFWGVAGSEKVFPIANDTPYKMYRIHITVATGGSYTSIAELRMLDITNGVLRSLTGGVAYVDANGNKVLTAPSPQLGAWPTNNEYDKYIVNFSSDLIQTGKTLDDVFHWSGAYTWCQDTDITASSSSNRALRGKDTMNTYYRQLTNYSSTTYGFRPVFEYQEVSN